MRNAYTDQEGTETVNGADSTLWDTDLDGYLSTDTHRGPSDSHYRGDGPSTGGGDAPQAHSDPDDTFIDEGDSKSSYYSPASLDEAQDEESTDQASTHTGLFHTTPRPAGDGREPAAADTTTPAPAADPSTADGSAPGDGDSAPLGEHDGATAAAAATTDAPTSDGAVVVDGPTDGGQPGGASPSHVHPPPSEPEPTASRVREGGSPTSPAQAGLYRRSQPETDDASSRTLPWLPPPHPDITTGLCATPGCDRPALYTTREAHAAATATAQPKLARHLATPKDAMQSTATPQPPRRTTAT